jgi:peroxiredoxin
LPSLERLRRALPGDQAVVLGVNVGETWETVASFIAGVEPAPGFPILFDEKSAVLKAWPVKGLPTTFVIDRNGRIALRAVGGREFDEAEPLAQIGALLREK